MGEEAAAQVRRQVSRVRMVYPATSWTKTLSAEYERVFADVGPKILEAVVSRVIDANDQRFCPPPGVFVVAAGEYRSAYQRTPTERQSIAEVALRDSYAALEDWMTGRQPMRSMFSRAELEGQVGAIRGRLGR